MLLAFCLRNLLFAPKNWPKWQNDLKRKINRAEKMKIYVDEKAMELPEGSSGFDLAEKLNRRGPNESLALNIMAHSMIFPISSTKMIK